MNAPFMRHIANLGPLDAALRLNLGRGGRVNPRNDP